MKYRLRRTFAGLVLFAVGCAHGQTNRFEMPMLGERLPVAQFELVSHIPARHWARIPKTLPVFRYSAKPYQFSNEGLQSLIDQSAFAGTNFADLLHGHSSVASVTEPIRLATAHSFDCFLVDASAGTISLINGGTGFDLRREIPPYDSVPTFDSIRDRLLLYAQAFGVSTNEMERKPDGSILLIRSDGKTVKMGGAIKFISERSVRVCRCIASYPLLNTEDKIELELGVHGGLRKFEMNWRSMEPVRTSRVCTIEQMLDNVRKGQVLGDVANQYPAGGVSQIVLKDFRVLYYVFRRDFRPVATNADIFPILSLHAVFKSEGGTSEEGGLYTPLLQP